MPSSDKRLLEAAARAAGADEVYARLVKLIGQGKSCRAIADQVGCCHASVAKIGRQLKRKR